MASTLLFALLLSLALVNGAPTPSASPTTAKPTAAPTQLQGQWQNWKKRWQRSYNSSREDDNRRTVYASNLKLAAARNAAEGGRQVHGETIFSDLSPSEFASMLSYRPSTQTKRPSFARDARELAAGATFSPSLGLVDWSATLTSQVRDQGYCGSCWAFSAVEQVEADVKRVLGQTVVLSTQQVTSCTSAAMGCNGGSPLDAYAYMSRGEEPESAYPYTSGAAGRTGRCVADLTKSVVVVTAYYQITAADASATETAMAAYVQNTGPLSIAISADVWSTYTGGILTVCPSANVNHAAQLVAIDGINGVWKIRNSWSAAWGENGYLRLKFGSNLCALTALATYTSPALYKPPSPAPSSPPATNPTTAPVNQPSKKPSSPPVAWPTWAPVAVQTKRPTNLPVVSPTPAPSSSGIPSPAPSFRPSTSPVALSTRQPNAGGGGGDRGRDKDRDERGGGRGGGREGGGDAK